MQSILKTIGLWPDRQLLCAEFKMSRSGNDVAFLLFEKELSNDSRMSLTNKSGLVATIGSHTFGNVSAQAKAIKIIF